MPETDSEADARYYRLATPAGREVTVRLDETTVVLQLPGHRPLVLDHDEAWAAWACFTDALDFPENAPEWVGPTIIPTDAEGRPLPAAAPAVSA
ncbi:hypothetical protein [Streptosporangium sp. CA-115845]|uniref:hypothetical protein n=1 Tax=Streptosporangium sp. CA-115845 TaxID=3240071 RepID=UPI003D9095A5